MAIPTTITSQMPVGSESDPADDRNRLFNHVIGASTRRSSAAPFASPRTISIVPSVTMNGTTLETGDEETVHQAARGGRSDAAQAGDGRGRALPQQDGDHDRRERDDRAHRQVDAARHDDGRHADRRHADDRRLARHQLQIAGLDELDPGEQREHERDEHQPDEGARAIQQGSCRHARAAPPVIVATIKSDSVRLETGCAGCSRPRNMTAMRSQTPSSSGR